MRNENTCDFTCDFILEARVFGARFCEYHLKSSISLAPPSTSNYAPPSLRTDVINYYKIWSTDNSVVCCLATLISCSPSYNYCQYSFFAAVLKPCFFFYFSFLYFFRFRFVLFFFWVWFFFWFFVRNE